MLSGLAVNLNLFFLFLLALAMALVGAEAFSGSLKHTTNLPVFNQLVSWKKQQPVKEFSPHHPQCCLMDVKGDRALGMRLMMVGTLSLPQLAKGSSHEARG